MDLRHTTYFDGVANRMNTTNRVRLTCYVRIFQLDMINDNAQLAVINKSKPLPDHRRNTSELTLFLCGIVNINDDFDSPKHPI